MPESDSRFVNLVRVLASHGVEYVLVGGVAAVLHGAPIVTKDLDILHRRTDANVEHLLAALRDLRAVYRDDSRNLTPGPSHLLGPGHHLLHTIHGDLDVLGTIERTTTYDDVIGSALEVVLGEVSVRVLDLARLIAAKEFANRPKDRAVLPILRATLAEIERVKS